MYRMLEVVGESPQGYTEAVRNAVETLAEAGEKPHWFEVTEFRGYVHDGKVKQYQAKVKVAVDRYLEQDGREK